MAPVLKAEGCGCEEERLEEDLEGRGLPHAGGECPASHTPLPVALVLERPVKGFWLEEWGPSPAVTSLWALGDSCRE